MFLVERSAYISQSNFQLVLNYITSITGAITYGNSGANYGLVVFGGSATNIFYLNNNAADRNVLANQILSVPYTADTQVSLNAALSQLRSAQFLSSRGDRSNAPNIAIIIMASSPSDSDVLLSANDAKSAGIKLLTIGIGAGANQFTLQSVSSPPQQLGVTVFKFNSYNDLSRSNTYTSVAYRAAWLAEGMCL